MENRQYTCGPMGWKDPRSFNTVPANITETEAEYTIHLYAPALIKENILITTQHDILSIRYKGQPNDLSNSFTRREYRTDQIERSFYLKGKVDVDKIKASYAEGILTIELPKTEAARKPSQQVRVG